MHYPSRKFLLFGYMFGYMSRYLFTTCRGKNMYKPCLLMYSAWYGHPAEVGVMNTVVLLPRGTRWEVQAARKISPWGYMKRTGILCHWHTTYEMSCALSATPSFSKLQMARLRILSQSIKQIFAHKLWARVVPTRICPPASADSRCWSWWTWGTVHPL